MNSVSRRSFVKLSALATGGAALSALSACSSISSIFSTEGLRDPGTLISSFFVVSDTHITEERIRSQDHFRSMLADIRSLEHQPSTIVLVGDITELGNPDEYVLIRQLSSEMGFDFDDDFIKVMGNHDQCNSRYPADGARDEQYYSDEHRLFLKEVGVSDVYYDLYVDGFHFIVLGPDAKSTDWTHFNFTSMQTTWLDNLLSADDANGDISFVFCHEPLHNTVRGTKEGSWGYRNSLYENYEISSIMERYPRAIYFSGHTHAYPDIKRPNPSGALYVNDGAVAAGQLSPTANYFADGFSGAFGIQVEIYEHLVDLKGRDFLERKWIDVRHKIALP